MRSLRLLCYTLALLLISNLSFAQSFSVKRYATGSGPTKVVSGDFNGDGKLDLATVDVDSGKISVLIGNGDGSFQLPQDYIVGSNPVGLAARDVNHDGKVDLITFSNQTTTDSSSNMTGGTDKVVFLISNGNGSFQQAQSATVAWKGNANGFATGDFNHDGKVDYAVAEERNLNGTSSSVVRILYGNGSTGVSSEKDYVDPGQQADTTNGESKYLVNGLEASDLNKDGWTDLVIIQCCGGFDVELGAVWVMMNNQAGGFTQKAVSGLSVPTGVSVFDLNNDGKNDILVPYEGCHTPCSGWASFVGNGDGTFTRGPGEDQDDLFFEFPTVFDFNGDGIVDIVWSARNRNEFTTNVPQDVLFFYPRHADGSLGTRTSIALGSAGENVVPLHILKGDYNKDGKTDIAIADRGIDKVSIALNTNSSGSTACTLKTTSPSVTICSPGAGATVSSPVHVLAYGKGVSSMQLYVDHALNSSVSGTTFDKYVTLASGSHYLTVKGWSGSTSYTDSRTITVGSGSTSSCSTGSVKISSPVNGGTYSSPVTISGSATSTCTIKSMKIYVDSVSVASSTTSSISKSQSMAAGTHNITVQAWNSAGVVFKSSVKITVK